MFRNVRYCVGLNKLCGPAPVHSVGRPVLVAPLGLYVGTTVGQGIATCMYVHTCIPKTSD